MASKQDESFQAFLERVKNKDPKLYEEYQTKTDSDEHRSIIDEGRKSFREVIVGNRFSEIIGAHIVEEQINIQTARVEEGIAKARLRPVLVIRDNRIVPEFVGPDVEVWKERLMGQESILNSVIPSVGRIEVNNNVIYSWVGTGWLVDSNVVVTNRHVASIFCQNKEGFSFKVGYPSGLQSAKVDFLEEDQRSNSFEFAIESVLWMAENDGKEPDIAFLKVKPIPNGPPLPKPIRLASSVNEGDTIVTIGYPARDPDVPDQDLVLTIFKNVYDKKRLAPGEVMSVSDVELEHDCSTLGGNSGSAVIRLATGEAVGLHFAGLYMKANYAVSSTKINELLQKLRQGTLPRMRSVELALPASIQNPTVPTMSSNYTFEAFIPIKITVEVGGMVIPGTTQVPSQPAPPTLNSFESALELARNTLRGQPGVLNVRPGYRFKNGWITNERVIAVEVQKKQTLPELRDSGKQFIPGQFSGIGVDIRTSSFTDQLASLGTNLESLEAPARAGLYKEPVGLSLEPVKERMRAVFHVSPDSGFPNLKKFIRRVEKTLTATMYEWEAVHISDEIFNAIKPAGRQLTMVTQRGGTKAAVQQLKNKLGTKFKHTWASVGPDKIIPKSYHIKVASRDRKEFWLSSGNWKESNQPNIDPAGDNSTLAAPWKNHNREWHVIIENEKLAALFEDYIKWDFSEAQRIPLDESLDVVLPDVFVPETIFDEGLERRRAIEYFDPLEIDRELEIQPLLTPDKDKNGQRIFIEFATKLIEGAEHSIYIQNQTFDPGFMDDAFERFFTVLKRKQQDGKEVRIIFRDFPGDATKKTLETIKDFGINTDAIKVQVGCHTKAIIVDAKIQDRATVLFGSHNLSNAGALYNRDASLLIKDAEVAAYFEKIFNYDWEVRADQKTNESVADIRIAGINEATPQGFRRVSLAEFLNES